jgi:hypothetical protein
MLKAKFINTRFYNNKHRRINKLNIQIKENNKSNKEFEDDYLVIAIDSTGIKVTNRGQWMQDKWNVKDNNKKGYLKIHIAVNIKSKKILSKKVSDEHAHDSKTLPELVENIIESDSITTIGKIFGDAAYDNNDVFRYLSDNGILPCIKVRKTVLELDGKRRTSLEIYQFWPRKVICKNARIALAMERGGLQKQCFLV